MSPPSVNQPINTDNDHQESTASLTKTTSLKSKTNPFSVQPTSLNKVSSSAQQPTMRHSASTGALPPPGARTYQYKLVLLGESAVGKSSIVLRFVRNVFYENQESTIGAAFLSQTMQSGDDTIKFEIWDTAGQERYHSLAPMYYRGAQAALVVYDITNKESFERAKRWVEELQRQAQPNIIIALVGNKLDLVPDNGESNVKDSSSATVARKQRQVDIADAQAYADEQNLIFLEASAKAGVNVRQVFERVASRLPKTEAQLALSRSNIGLGGSRLNLGVAAGGSQESTTGVFSRSCC